MKTAVIIIVAVVVVAAVGVGAFFAGKSYGEKRLLSSPEALFQAMRSARGGQAGAGPFGQAGAGPFGQPGQATAIAGQTGTQGRVRFGEGAAGGGTIGTVEKIEGDTLIISTNEGRVTIKTSDTTLIEKFMQVKLSDLEVGKQVIVSGTKNADGSINARLIQSLRSPQSGRTGGQ